MVNKAMKIGDKVVVTYDRATDVGLGWLWGRVDGDSHTGVICDKQQHHLYGDITKVRFDAAPSGYWVTDAWCSPESGPW